MICLLASFESALRCKLCRRLQEYPPSLAPRSDSKYAAHTHHFILDGPLDRYLNRFILWRDFASATNKLRNFRSSIYFDATVAGTRPVVRIGPLAVHENT